MSGSIWPDGPSDPHDSSPCGVPFVPVIRYQQSTAVRSLAEGVKGKDDGKVNTVSQGKRVGRLTLKVKILWGWGPGVGPTFMAIPPVVSSIPSLALEVFSNPPASEVARAVESFLSVFFPQTK